MSEFGVIDLSADTPFEGEEARAVAIKGTVNLEELRGQLEEIRDAFVGFTDSRASGAFSLQSLEIALTVGVEGRVWFIAKGSAEASITLTFERPET